MNIKPIQEAFNSAIANGVQYPKLRFNNGIVFSRAPVTGVNKGFLYINQKWETLPSNHGTNHLGKVAPNSDFYSTPLCTLHTMELLDAITKAPLEAAQAYGKEFGICSCCGRTFTNHISIELGIDPTCRGHYGWGPYEEVDNELLESLGSEVDSVVAEESYGTPATGYTILDDGLIYDTVDSLTETEKSIDELIKGLIMEDLPITYEIQDNAANHKIIKEITVELLVTERIPS